MAVHAQTNYTLTTKPAKTSLLGGHFIYRVDTTQGTLTPSSANIIENVADNPQQWGYNTHIGANGIKLRHNEITLSEWKADHLTFYKPGTNNPSLELISGVNTALNIYNPTNNTKTLGLDVDGLNFYGTSISTPDVTLNADGLTLINGSIRGGIVGQDEFLYLSPQVFADEYEEYVLSEDTEVDETKVYYIRSDEEGAYIYTEVSEPTGNPQENEYYEIAHAPGTIPIDDYVKDNWRQIIGRKFAVDTDGNLYANGLNANNANIEGNITATSLRIGSGSDAYDGAAAINISGYDIEIEKNGTDEVEDVSVYLYPILYHNGVQVPTIEVDYSHFIWYQDDSTIGTEGDEENSGRYLATYGHNYRVIYDFDDGAVGGGTEVVDRTIDPSKYITKISDTGITIHPEVWTNQSSYIQLDGNGVYVKDSNNNILSRFTGTETQIGMSNGKNVLINSDGVNIIDNQLKLASFTATAAQLGQDAAARFVMGINSLQAYNNNNNKYFEISEGYVQAGGNESNITINNSGIKGIVNQNDFFNFSNSDTFVDVAGPIEQILEAPLKDFPTIEEPNSFELSLDKSTIFYFTVSLGGWGKRFDIGVASSEQITRTLDSESYTLYISYNGDTTVTYYLSPASLSNYIIDITVGYRILIPTPCFELGQNSTVTGGYSIAEGYNHTVSGNYAHAEGRNNTVNGNNAHAEGLGTKATGGNAHAEGDYSEASGYDSHAECKATASGDYAHAEGVLTYASGNTSHVEGRGSRAIGEYSHAQNWYTIANGEHETVIGEYNIETPNIVEQFTGDGNTTTFQLQPYSFNYIYHIVSVTINNVKTTAYSRAEDTLTFDIAPANGAIIKVSLLPHTYAFIIGNGTGSTRSNALTVAWNGNTTIAGTLTQSSDRKLKNHISYLSNDANEFIRSLKPAYFKKDDQFHVGFYAQDVEQSDKWHCMTGEMNGFKTLGYTEIIAPLVAYCQHLEERIKQLEEK